MKTLPKEKLTAYALEELSATERAELEALLANSPADQEYAGETREFCQLLQQTIGGNAAPAALTAAQKEAIAKTIPFAANNAPKKRWPIYAFGTAAAAAVAVWLAMPYFSKPEASLVADNKAPTGPATSSSQPEEVSKLFKKGQGYYDVGQFHEAGKAFNQILAMDPNNSEARRQLENTERQSTNYLRSARDHTRSSAIANVDQSGKTPVPRTEDTTAGPVSGPQTEITGNEQGSQIAGNADVLSASTAPLAMRAKSDSKEVYFEGDASALAKHRELAGNQTSPIAPAPASGGVRSMRTESQKSLDLASDSSPGLTNEIANVSGPEGGLAGKGRGAAFGDGFGLSIAESKPGESTVPLTREQARGYDFRDNERLGYRARTEPLAQQPEAPANESYIAPAENPFRSAAAEPLSTFSIDVDTASYANVRRFLNMGQRPPAEAVRLEELVNYFRYDYPAPAEGKPCSITADLVSCPWNENHRLARVGLKARTDEKRPNANLVFLLDVSGSMNEPNKLPLVKKSLHLLVDKLTENDRVSIVVYAGASGLVLPPTHGENKKAILGAIDNLQPGGSTNGASGITLAYEEARKGFIKEGVNRVILATDGDFNVGISDRDGLQSLIEKEAKSGVFLSVLGYGMGNLKDSTMEVLADKGNGNYAYIDSLGEARKVLAEEMSSTLVTVAKDVKVQIDFNPAKVRSYRLLGYENRMLAKEDFNNDKKDAGEIGAGHTVTALYEIIPADAPLDVPAVDPSKYQTPVAAKEAPPVVNDSPDSMTVKVRYKAPDGDVSQLMEFPVIDQKKPMAEASGDTKFATAVAGYALLLKGSNQAGNLNWAMVRELAKAGKGADAEGYRGEFMGLVDKAEGLVR